jgi:hypothetical protein
MWMNSLRLSLGLDSLRACEKIERRRETVSKRSRQGALREK